MIIQDEEEHGTLNQAKFTVTLQELVSLVDSYRERTYCQDLEQLEALGGTQQLVQTLMTNQRSGISSSTIQERAEAYGSNKPKEMKRKSFWRFCWEAFMDKIMIILFVLGILSLLLGIFLGEHPEIDWIEGLAIIIAVAIVVFVTGVNDFQKDKKFEKLQKIRQNRQFTNVIRDGSLQSMHPSELVVGDVIELSDGNILPVDGVILEANNVEIDESALTGENEKLKKVSFEEALALRKDFEERNPEIANSSELKTQKHLHEIPSSVCISGTTISEGRCLVLVVAVGQNSAEGRIMQFVQQEDERTPLEIKLDKITDLVSMLGLVFASIAVLILFIRMFVELGTGDLDWEKARLMDSVDFILIGITVLVLAIPEGLPLAVTISLAYSVLKMQNDNNLVKRMQACETMGGANEVCSDKTGTLTTNHMTVAKVWVDGEIIEIGQKNVFSAYPEYFSRFKEGVCILTNARLQDDTEYGSKTEVAVIKMLLKFGHSDYLEIRNNAEKVAVFPFSSVRKRASAIVKSEGTLRGYVLGASEMVLENCSGYLDKSGQTQTLDASHKQGIANSIETLAGDGLRTVLLAFRDLPGDYDSHAVTDQGFPQLEAESLVAVAVIGISDPVRPGVQDAVTNCKRAHITVRMVTGDNIITARAIAKECGILTSEQNVMEGKDFAARVGSIICKSCKERVCNCTSRVDTVANLDEFKEVIKNIEVLARSQPEHKYLLVTGLKEMGSVVAVTGDGTNDAPALKKADVGFAMGIAGTEHAREAADIILIDDNFSSIIQAVKWGRNIFDSIKKFLQFQLTVNVVAVTLAIVGAVAIKQSPLTAVQILWVNLIMDTLAALALATELPTDKLLDRYPHGRNETIVTPEMWKNIFGHAFVQCILLLLMVFLGEWFLIEDGDGSNALTNDDAEDYVISGRDYNVDGSEDYKKHFNDHGPSRHMTYIFNVFVFLQLMNEFNARWLDNTVNVFSGLHRNFMFIGIWLLTVFVQALMVSIGGYALGCHLDGLTAVQWFISLALSLVVFPARLVLILLPAKCFNRLARVGNQQLARRLSSNLRRDHGSINRMNIS